MDFIGGLPTPTSNKWLFTVDSEESVFADTGNKFTPNSGRYICDRWEVMAGFDIDPRTCLGLPPFFQKAFPGFCKRELPARADKKKPP